MTLSFRRHISRLTAGLLLLAAASHAGATQDRIHLTPPTALDRYVARPDPEYSWHLVNTTRGSGYTTYVVDMVSQSWLSTNEVNRALWHHWLTIVRPDQAQSNLGMLFITGGSNRKQPPEKPDDNIVKTATNTATVVTELRNVPNEPLTFNGETAERTEDGIIAYTWDKFLRSGDEKWPLRLPMTKAAVRAMDTISAVCAASSTDRLLVDRFFVAGGSKRGWTTWTTAAVDSRVVAIAPIVIDLLNIEPSFIHHWKAYGFWAPAIRDYVAMNIMAWTGTPEYHALMKIEEPYEYRARLNIPKFLINASGDQFFLPDSSQFYFKDLPGVKYLRYVPNADHSLKGSDAWETLLASYRAIVQNLKLPQFSWSSGADGTLRVTTAGTERPAQVKFWEATNPKARDFRLMTIGPAWQSTDLTNGPGPTYVAKPAKPLAGWTAYFVELTYTNGTPTPFKFTTDVKVIPDLLPFPYTPPTRPN